MQGLTPHNRDGACDRWARSTSSPRLVVIAASAGGFDALRRVLSRLPATFPAAIAYVQHRSAEAPDRLIELLSKSTAMKVCHAQDGIPLQAGTVYVCPPGVHMVAEHTLRLVPGPKLNYVRPSADLMLDSVARAYGDRAVGVVLSGSGSDGAVGSLMISRAGGIVIAQEAESCLFSDMPNAACTVGATDLRLPPEQIAAALQELVQDHSVPLHLTVTSDRTKVLPAGDHQIVVEGLRILIDSEKEMQVVGQLEDGLGLAIAHPLIEPLVGSINVNNAGVDQEVTSLVRLPVANPASRESTEPVSN